MASREENKRQAKEARLAAEQEQQGADSRRRRITLLGAALGLAAIVVVALVLVSGSDDSSSDATPNEVVAGLEGIPQKGFALGDPDAPVTIVEFADPQCPFCAQFSTDVLPDLIDDYVSTGDVRLELRLLTFIGEDSQRLAGAAYAAGDEDGLWEFIELAFARQGVEGSGYADDEFIESVATDAGLDADAVLAGASGDDASGEIAEAADEAQQNGVSSTPSFLIGPTGGELKPLEVDSLSIDSFSAPIDQALDSAG